MLNFTISGSVKNCSNWSYWVKMSKGEKTDNNEAKLNHMLITRQSSTTGMPEREGIIDSRSSVLGIKPC